MSTIGAQPLFCDEQSIPTLYSSLAFHLSVDIQTITPKFTFTQNDTSRASSIFCHGPLLDAIQMSRLFMDSKEFVDMPMKKEPEEILAHFALLKQPYDRQELREFIEENFGQSGADLITWRPSDIVDSPKFLGGINNEEYQKWAKYLNDMWPELARMTSPDVFTHVHRHSILPRRFPMIVPGGRFRESYYWDTYWIAKGLLACEMYVTSIGIVQNLLDDVENFGFVPNGSRIYYLNRSQPPLLSDMVLDVFLSTRDIEWLQKAVKTLDKEYYYWMNPENNKVVRFPDGGILNRYFANTTSPRPESYAEDIETGHSSPHANFIYLQMATGAETGWDYSSRWLSGPNTHYLNLSDIITTMIVPVDLNAMLFRMERNMSRIHEFLESKLSEFPSEKFREFNSEPGKKYFEAAIKRSKSIEKWLWDSQTSCWRDFRIDTQTQSIRNSISNWVVPLWSGLLDFENEEKIIPIINSFKASGLIQAGGAMTSDLETKQQWDAPNVWPPVMSMMIEALERINEKKLAISFVKLWLESNLIGWLRDKNMHEKYHAYMPGASGIGGEYIPQVGFGWSNGVALDLLAKYGSEL